MLKLIPYGFYDAKGEPQGYLYEILTAMLKDMGRSEDVKIVPLKRMIKEFQAGVHDCTLVANSPLAKTLFRIIEPVGKTIRLGILPNIETTITDYEGLKTLKIGVPLGVSFDKKFGSDSTLTKIQTTDYLESVRMLSHGRINAVAGNIDSFYYNAKKTGYSPSALFGDPLIVVNLDLVLACNKEKPPETLIQQLKSSLQKLKKSGKAQEIIDKYL